MALAHFQFSSVHGLGQTAESDRGAGIINFRRRGKGQRRGPLVVRGRLREVRCRAHHRLRQTDRQTVCRHCHRL
eukprot:scaffold40082_cov65-Phaeocystis_antarctica.AAC.4